MTVLHHLPSKRQQQQPPPPVSFCLQVTESTREQQRAEAECSPFFVDLTTLPHSQLDHLREVGLLSSQKEEENDLDICLLAEKHIAYLEQVWKQQQKPQLRSSFVSLDSSRTWMIYWSLHAVDLIAGRQQQGQQQGQQHDLLGLIKQKECSAIVQTLESCWTKTSVLLPAAMVQNDPMLCRRHRRRPRQEVSNTSIHSDNKDNDDNDNNNNNNELCELEAGGFGGGPGQMPHAATTYAAILALCILASREETALTLLEHIREPLYAWIISLQGKDGSFRMHHDGEVDVRATYCLVAVASLLNLLNTPLLNHDATAAFVASCQTWEGGFGGEPFAEAHGGYTFCAIAALQLLGRTDTIDLEALAGYLTRRQMALEGGFNGRANKLVDGCYSMWQGGALAIVSALLLCHPPSSSRDKQDPWLSSQDHPSSLLFDRAMLERYILLCAQDVNGGLRDKPSKNRDHYHSCYNISGLSVAQHWDKSSPSFGHPSLSKVGCTHPCYNIRMDHVEYCLKHFQQKYGTRL